MPRQIRIQYEGAIYHVLNRGDRREDIFLNDVDRQDFLKTLAEACQKTGWQVQAYCLMRNHFHLVVETPNANLVTGMSWLLSTYTSASTTGTCSLGMCSAVATRLCEWKAVGMGICSPCATMCI